MPCYQRSIAFWIIQVLEKFSSHKQQNHSLTSACKVNVQELSHRRCGSHFFSASGPADTHSLSYRMGKNTHGFHFLWARNLNMYISPVKNFWTHNSTRVSQWPRGLRRRSARMLRLWVRIPPRAWMFVCCECCVLSGRGICDKLITRPKESYRLRCVVVCDLETSWMRRPWSTGGRRAKNKQKNKQ